LKFENHIPYIINLKKCTRWNTISSIIYNRGNNREDLFRGDADYEYFMNLLEKYINPVAETFAWVLLKNHFHLLIRIIVNENLDSKTSVPTNSDGSIDSVRLRQPYPTRHFSHLFNAYARHYNLKYKRTGALFERPFKRIEVTSNRYLRQLVVYIHNNPVHHDFTDDFTDYPWSSFQSIISSQQTKPQQQQVVDWFADIENPRAVHHMKVDGGQYSYWNKE